MKYSIDELDNMEGHDFEYAVADLLRYNGWRDVEVTQGSGDYGIDILARRGSTRYAIQCKRYSKAVGVKAVQEAGLGVDYYHCDAAAVITNNYFTKQAETIAKVTGVRLWGRNFLESLIQNYDEGYDELYVSKSSVGTDMAKVCPVCGREFLSSSTKCPICKCDLIRISPRKEANRKSSPKQASTTEKRVPAQQLPKASKNSVKHTLRPSNLSLIALVLSFLGPLCALGIILAIVDLAKKNGYKKTYSVIALIVGCFMATLISYFEDSITNEHSNTSSNTAANSYYSENRLEDNLQKPVNSENTVGSPTETDNNLDMNERLKAAIVNGTSNLDDEDFLRIWYRPEENFTSITFVSTGGLTKKMSVHAAYMKMSGILESIQPIIDTNVRILVETPIIDAHGNSSMETVIVADYTLETIRKINFERFLWENIPVIADSWWNYPDFSVN